MNLRPDARRGNGEDPEGVSTFVARAARRARATLAVETLLIAALAASAVATGAWLAGQSGTARAGWLAAAAGVTAGLAWTTRRRRQWSLASVTARLEAHGRLQNLLVTALELEAHPNRATPRIRALVNQRASSLVQQIAPTTIWPTRRLLGNGVAAVLASAAAFALLVSPPRASSTSPVGASSVPGHAAPLVLEHVEVTVTPPQYTGRPPTRSRDADRVDALAGSRVTWRVATRAEGVEMMASGSRQRLTRTSDGLFETTVDAVESGLVTFAATAARDRPQARRATLLVVQPDRAPEVSIERPGSDLIGASPTHRLHVVARATDDLGLATLTLHYTRVTGAGEQFGFTEGQLPWKVTPDSAREWRSAASRTLAALGLEAGDILVYHARATDRRPGAPPAVSDSYVIEVGKPQEATSGGFAVPPEADREGLSLSALIQKTERLDARRTSMPDTDFAEAARGLAIEQRMVRTEVLFLMGAHGHVGDEEAEAAHSHEIQEGRLENFGQDALRVATQLMATAERSLVAADTRAALVDQRRALAALQRALSRQRYFLRTLATRSRIDPSRRLAGDLSEARSWRRGTPRRLNEHKVDDARAILAALAAAAPNLATVAERLLAIDPASTALQDATRVLLQAAGTPDPGSPARQHAISVATQAVLTLMREVPAPSDVPGSPTRSAVQGAWIDALEAVERRP